MEKESRENQLKDLIKKDLDSDNLNLVFKNLKRLEIIKKNKLQKKECMLNKKKSKILSGKEKEEIKNRVEKTAQEVKLKIEKTPYKSKLLKKYNEKD